MEGARAEVELLDVGDVRGGRSSGRGSLVVGPTGEAGEAFGLEDLIDGDRADGVAVGVEGAADVGDGEVLLAQGNDTVAEGLLLGGGVRPPGSGQEEGSGGILAEVQGQRTKKPGTAMTNEG